MDAASAPGIVALPKVTGLLRSRKARTGTGSAGIALALLAMLAAPAPVSAEAPLSVIDWLSHSIATAAAPPRPDAVSPRTPFPGVVEGLGPDGLPLTQGIDTTAISVSPIDAPTSDAVGLLPAARSGLPRDIWGAGPGDRLAVEIGALGTDTLPALRDLIFTLLLTEFVLSTDAQGRGALFLARVDKLLDFGALDQALALIEAVGTDSPALFRRWFDIALLLGDEEAACAALRTRPELEPSYPARIFCLARGGDWPAAALTLRSAQALDLVTEAEEALLSRFLDPELFEASELEPSLLRPSPLTWRMLEAIGEPVQTRTLPVAFAQADLRSNAGWRAQLEAVERLARTGAASPNRLLGLYTERRPAASGGLWDRVSAVQRLDAALSARDAEAVANALPRAWEEMARAELEPVLAELFADRMKDLPLQGPAAALAFRLGLLTADYAEVARTHTPADAREAFLVALALGDMAAAPPPQDALAAAIRDGFSSNSATVGGPAGSAAGTQPADEALGDALLRALRRLADGAAGELRGATDGIAILRQAGLDDIARRAALQMLILDRRG